MEKQMDFDREVDARGLNCPLPILRLKKALSEMSGGRIVRVLATDPSAVKDFEAFVRQTGHELLRQEETPDKTFEFFIRHK
jgi:tRNA 2-thiouridine synthesizing protein A